MEGGRALFMDAFTLTPVHIAPVLVYVNDSLSCSSSCGAWHIVPPRAGRRSAALVPLLRTGFSSA